MVYSSEPGPLPPSLENDGFVTQNLKLPEAPANSVRPGDGSK